MYGSIPIPKDNNTPLSSSCSSSSSLHRSWSAENMSSWTSYTNIGYGSPREGSGIGGGLYAQEWT